MSYTTNILTFEPAPQLSILLFEIESFILLRAHRFYKINWQVSSMDSVVSTFPALGLQVSGIMPNV